MEFCPERTQSYREWLKKLLEQSAPSGKERALVENIKQWVAPYAKEVFLDSFGNLIAHIGGEGPKVLITAHVDELGYWVKSITDEGFLHVAKVGGMPDKLVEARQVVVNGRIPGIMGTMAGHLQTPEERRQIMNPKEWFIDIGVRSREEAEALGVTVGSYATTRYNYMEMANADLVCCKALDDRAGCAALIQLMEELVPEALAVDLTIAFTLQEETGLKGALAAANVVEPEFAIAIDTVPCADTPGLNWRRDLPLRIGGGVVCSLSEGAGPMNFIHPELEAWIFAAAARHEIPIQPAVACALSIATDASAMSTAGRGSKAGALTLARRYSHSAVEMMDIRDAICLVELLKRMVTEGR